MSDILLDKIWVVSFPDGQYLNRDGEYSNFFYCACFDTPELAMNHATSFLEPGIFFEIKELLKIKDAAK